MSSKSTNAQRMLRKRGQIAMEKALLRGERLDYEYERGVEKFSGQYVLPGEDDPEEAYKTHLAGRECYRRHVALHEEAGGFIYKTGGKKFADTTDGWAHEPLGDGWDEIATKWSILRGDLWQKGEALQAKINADENTNWASEDQMNQQVFDEGWEQHHPQLDWAGEME